MTYCGPAPTASLRPRHRSPDGAPSRTGRDGLPPGLGVTVYGCDPDEAELFREVGPRLGLRPTTVTAALSEANLGLASGNRCISVDHRTPIPSGTLMALSRAGVEYISARSVGFDHIDMECAGRVGVLVEPVAYSPDSVADYTLMLILMLLRRTKETISRSLVHDYRLSDARGRELRDMTVGVIGTGRIGGAVVDRLRGFGGRVLAHDRCPQAAVEYVGLDALLQESDVVTLHTPLNPDTRHLLDRRRIEEMKPGALVVNTARGPLVDTDALLAALEGGRIGGAALDVLEGERDVFYADHRLPPLEHRQVLRLQRLPNVLITPHTAYYTEHSLRDLVENTLLNCLRFEEQRHG